jgi:hypothetical protein
MVRGAVLLVALSWGSAALAQDIPAPSLWSRSVRPQLDLGRSSFSLPVIDYQAPDGSRKQSRGIIIGRDIAPNATVGVGLFRMRLKSQEGAQVPPAGKSRKVALGVTIRF